MIRAGYSPSVRLFEAAACGVPIISDYWDGLETFFVPGREILVVALAGGHAALLCETAGGGAAAASARRARERVLDAHTAAHRAAELERYAMISSRAGAASRAPTDPMKERRLPYRHGPPEAVRPRSSAPGEEREPGLPEPGTGCCRQIRQDRGPDRRVPLEFPVTWYDLSTSR